MNRSVLRGTWLGFVLGVASASSLATGCAAPEDLTPDIVAGGERQLYDLKGVGGSTPAPSAMPSATAVPSATAMPSAFAPSLLPPAPLAEGAEVAPPDSIPLQQWIEEQRALQQ